MTNQMDLFKLEHSIDDSKGTKVCHKCNLEKPLSSFQQDTVQIRWYYYV